MRPRSFTDGLANEPIIDPSGAGTGPAPSGEGGGGGCFISTAICDLTMELGFSPGVTLALGVLLVSLVGFSAGITVKRKTARRKA